MSLEIEEDPKFNRREWIVQRIGWVVMLLILCVGATGLAGRGPLGRRDVSAERFSITYDRVMRYDAPGTIKLYLSTVSDSAQSTAVEKETAESRVADSLVYVWGNQAFLDGCDPQLYTPAPAKSSIHGDTVYLAFHSTAVPRGRITILCSPRSIGQYQVHMGVLDGPTHSFPILVLP